MSGPDASALAARRRPSPRRAGEVRGPFERDRARLVHSAAFRRLQAKTQVLGIGGGDFHRTRLTHSMEAAQIGAGVRRVLLARHPERAALLPDRDLVESLGLAHDLGHPPFGHEGECALNYCVVRATSGRLGFEGNGQTLRLVARLESHTPGFGLNLTRRTLLGLLKYPVPFSRLAPARWPPAEPRPLHLAPWYPPKCYHDEESDVVDWILSPFDPDTRAYLEEVVAVESPEGRGRAAHRGLDASILELADDIAYGTHDLEDGVALGLIRREHAQDLERAARTPWARRHGLGRAVAEMFSPASRKQAVGALVHALVTACRLTTVEDGVHPLAGVNAVLLPEAQEFLSLLKALVTRHMIEIPAVRTMRFRAQQMLIAVFEALLSDPEHLLPADFARRCARGEEAARVTADYVSGMTDAFATRTYERLYLPEASTVFERT
ncbi:MAG: dGTPase [Firmicutes bacterium]|nr:dGTPase [Bacillota bacterium]